MVERQGASEQHAEVGAEEASEMGHAGTWELKRREHAKHVHDFKQNMVPKNLTPSF